MRKSDKRLKPQLHKLDNNKVRTKPTPEEQELAQKTLDLAKSQQKPFKMIPRGFSNAFSKKNTVT